MASLGWKTHPKVDIIPDILALFIDKDHPRKGAKLLFCKSEIFSEKWRVMEHFGFLTVPDAIIPSYPVFEK